MFIYVFLCHVSAVPVWLAFDDGSDDYIEPEEIGRVEIICLQNDSVQYIHFMCYLNYIPFIFKSLSYVFD